MKHKGLLVAVGRTLRAERLRGDRTIVELAATSNGRFGAPAIGAYERADREISLRRFCDLAGCLAVEPTKLLGVALADYRRHQGVLPVPTSTGEEAVTVRTVDRDTPIKAHSANRRSAEPR